jgi:hypothetical protein
MISIKMMERRNHPQLSAAEFLGRPIHQSSIDKHTYLFHSDEKFLRKNGKYSANAGLNV